MNGLATTGRTAMCTGRTAMGTATIIMGIGAGIATTIADFARRPWRSRSMTRRAR